MKWIREPLFSLESRVAVVTGAASGIGAATCEMFAAAGADVVLGWYPPDGHDVQPVLDAVQAAGRRAIVVAVDVRNQRDCDNLVSQAVATFGRLDVVVANAGVARREPLPETTDEKTWEFVLDVNLGGVWRCFKSAIPHMRSRAYGRLLATTSVSGPLRGWEGHAAYSASKAGMVGLVKTLAVELGPAGITVNAVAPGTVESPQSLDPVNSLGVEGVARQAAMVPVGRVGTADDIAAAFLYLASARAGYVNGEVLVVDGGRWLA